MSVRAFAAVVAIALRMPRRSRVVWPSPPPSRSQPPIPGWTLSGRGALFHFEGEGEGEGGSSRGPNDVKNSPEAFRQRPRDESSLPFSPQERRCTAGDAPGSDALTLPSGRAVDPVGGTSDSSRGRAILPRLAPGRFCGEPSDPAALSDGSRKKTTRLGLATAPGPFFETPRIGETKGGSAKGGAADSNDRNCCRERRPLALRTRRSARFKSEPRLHPGAIIVAKHRTATKLDETINHNNNFNYRLSPHRTTAQKDDIDDDDDDGRTMSDARDLLSILGGTRPPPGGGRSGGLGGSGGGGGGDPAETSLLSFKAGKMTTRLKSNGKYAVEPDPRRGEVRVVWTATPASSAGGRGSAAGGAGGGGAAAATGHIKLEWRDRRTKTVVNTVPIFPEDDAAFERVETGREGDRVYLLGLRGGKTEDSRHFFWLDTGGGGGGGFVERAKSHGRSPEAFRKRLRFPFGKKSWGKFAGGRRAARGAGGREGPPTRLVCPPLRGGSASVTDALREGSRRSPFSGLHAPGKTKARVARKSGFRVGGECACSVDEGRARARALASRPGRRTTRSRRPRGISTFTCSIFALFLLFRMQDKDVAPDEDVCVKVNLYMSDYSEAAAAAAAASGAAAAPSDGAEPLRLRPGDAAGMDNAELLRIMQGALGSQNRADEGARTTTVPGSGSIPTAGAGQVDALGNILENLTVPHLGGTPAGERTADSAAAEGSGAAAAGSGAGGGLTLADLRGAMAGLATASPPAAAPGPPLAELASNDVVEESGILSDPDAVARLVALLPEGQRTEEDLRDNLRSPQAAQCLQRLTAALADDAGSFNSIIANFQLNPGDGAAAMARGDPIAAFLECLLRDVERSGEVKEETKEEEGVGAEGDGGGEETKKDGGGEGGGEEKMDES
ncbi:hypothetical protein ACHAWF_013099 [Thalassiosira exigua]